MSIGNLLRVKQPNKEKRELPKALCKYEKSDFGLQQRVRFIYYLCIAIIASLVLMIFYTSYIQLISPNYGKLYFPVLIPEIVILLIVIICIILIIRGYSIASTHLLLISSLATVWIVMWMDKNNETIARLDTIVFILGILSMLPLLINRYKRIILLYILLNIAVLFVFIKVFKNQLGLSNSALIDYIADNSIALIFIGIVGYSIFRINKRSLERAISDINERHEIEKVLLESEEKYRTLMESLNEVIIVADNDHKVQYVNRKFTEILGYTSDEIIGKIGYTMLHDPDDFKIIEKANSERINKIISQYELPFITKDGKKIDLLVNGAPIINSEGKTLGSIGAMINITEIKKAEKALKESEEKYRTLMENMNEVVIMVDNDDRIRYVNKRFTEKLGYSSSEVIGEIGYKMLFNPLDQEIIANPNHKARKYAKNQYEITFASKNGNKIFFLVSAGPLTNTEGRTIGSIITMVDITEKKLIEKELEKYRDHLEHMVNERTEELAAANEELTATNEELYNQRKELEATLINLKETQNKLVQSEKMASLGVLAAGVAHEINNPLNFINGGAVGLENYLNENLKEHLKEVHPLIEGIQVGVKRAADIVTSLNHYSRKDDLPSSICNVHSVIDNCLVMLNSQMRNKVEIKKEYTKDPYSVFCNEGRLHQVFLNILANSVQSIEDNGTISIFTRVEKGHITISISDTGCGISKDILPKITDPFFTTKDPGKGTGLGLSITYNILNEYNGTLKFESQLGVGTKAIITLPLND